MKDPNQTLLAQYDILARTTSDISTWRQNANMFYISVNTTILGIAMYLNSSANFTSIFFCIIGIIVAVVWKENIQSYKRINKAKFKVLLEIEKKLAYRIFAKEEEYYNKEDHKELTHLESKMPILFIVAYVLVIAFVLFSKVQTILDIITVGSKLLQQ